MDLIPTINHSIQLVTRLREITKNIEGAEFKNLLADLSNELADAKLKMVELKEQIAALQTENQSLRATQGQTQEKPTGVHWGCYYFGDIKNGLYCTACWDKEKRKSLTTRIDTRFRMCPVCNAKLGVG